MSVLPHFDDGTDPTPVHRLRDGVYAADMLIVAIAELDLFTYVDDAGAVGVTALCERFGLDARAADVMVTYLVALGLLERRGDELRLSGAGSAEVETRATAADRTAVLAYEPA